MRLVSIIISCLLLGLASAGWAIDAAALRAVKRAQAFRARGEAVQAAPDGTYFCEAEEFKASRQGWQAQPWGENYYAATIFNAFLSRKAFLGAPEQCRESAATITADIKEPGKYLVLARYEAAYRFETQFRIRIEQGGEVVFDRLYGARKNLKIWVYGKGITEEADYQWGSSQSVVWEGHEAFAELQPGKAVITLIAGPQPEPAAKRNVDLIMLTRDEEQVKTRIAKEGYLPLDGWLTQADDVWMKVANAGEDRVTVNSTGFKEHSPYWVHMRNWQQVKVEVEPGQTADWVEVGSTMDSLNDGQWGFQSSGPCSLIFGVRDAAGRIETIRTFRDVNGRLDLVGYADVRYSRKVETQQEALKRVVDYLRKIPNSGKAPSETLIVAHTSVKEFNRIFGVNGEYVTGPKGYLDWRGLSAAQLEEKCKALGEEERNNIAVMSLGDEIGLPSPSGAATTAGFAEFLRKQDLAPGDVDPAAGGDWAKLAYNPDAALKETNPGLYYWSQRYRHAYGIAEMKKLTDVLRGYLPNAGIGANFSPHAGAEHAFLNHAFQWIDCFREDGMTQPWSEDYAWQLPLGSQQVNGINLAQFRDGLRGKLDRKIHFYVMPHMPGQSPRMWRRMFFNAMGGGAKVFNLFEFQPVWLAYTENHVTGNEMYAMVLKTLREFGRYEDIVQAGQVRPSKVGLWFSDTGDIWGDYASSGGAAKRALYVSILHQQLPVDVVSETDAKDGSLNDFKVLYLTDAHVSRAASEKIAGWVERGGRLFATAGAGMFDEYNRPNDVLRALLGVELLETVAPPEARIGYEKQDLPFAPAVEQVTWLQDNAMHKAPVFGAITRIAPIVPDPAGFTQVFGTFADKSPAVVKRIYGNGSTLYCAFLPGLSYFKPAIPLRPLDVNSRDDAMCQLLPTDFDAQVGRLIGSVASDDLRPVITTDNLVETAVIDSPIGTLVTLDNWRGKPLKNLRVQVNFPVPTGRVSLASGGRVKVEKAGAGTVFILDLDVADALILREPLL